MTDNDNPRTNGRYLTDEEGWRDQLPSTAKEPKQKPEGRKAA